MSITEAVEALSDFPLSSAGALLAVVWAFIVGSAFGSFLNVVAYRLPLGLSLSHPPSRCPRCERRIRWYDNVPILGWLWLRGKCRDCGAKISIRYPLVEFLVAAASAAVMASALTSAPIPDTPEYTVNLLVVGLRLTWLYGLSTVVLLEFDESRLPLRFVTLMVMIVLAGELFIPELRPRWALPAMASPPGVVHLLYLAAVAIVFGLLAWPLLMLAKSKPADAACRLLVLVLTALVAGGHAMLLAAPVAALVLVVRDFLTRFWPGWRRIGWAVSLLVVSLLCMTLVEPPLGAGRRFALGESAVYLPLFPDDVLVIGGLLAVLSVVGRAIPYVTAPPIKEA